MQATLTGADAWEELFGDVPEIEYYAKSETTGCLTNLLLQTALAEEKLSEAPSEIGTYTAKITYEGNTAEKDFEISAVPKTGDNTPTELLLLLLSISSLAAILLVKKSRKMG